MIRKVARTLATGAILLPLWCACSSDDEKTPSDAGPDVSTIADGQADGDASGEPSDGAASRLSSCVERPTDLPRPPAAGQLPCDLIPPGLTLDPH